MVTLNLKQALLYGVPIVILLVIAFIAPVLAIIAICGGLAWWLGGKSLRGPVMVTLLALVVSVVMGFGVYKLQSIPRLEEGRFIPQKPQPLIVRSWFSMEPLSNPANRAGRVGLLLGGFGGVFMALAIRRRGDVQLHGPGIVQGRPVVKGGWADDKEAAKICDFGPPKTDKYGGGVVLGKLNGRVMRVPIGKQGIAAHTAVFGSTGAGKTFGFVLPNIVSSAHEGWSMVIADPKGELVAGKYNDKGEYEPGIAEWLKKKGYEILVLNFKNPSQGTHRWNPLFEAKDDSEFRQLCEAMILCTGKENPFFAGGEANLFTALVGLTRYGQFLQEDMRHMRTVLSFLSWPVEELEVVFEKEYRQGILPAFFYEKWKAVKNMFNNFATGVVNKVAVMTDGPLAALTAGHDLDLESIAKKKTALFCILPTIGDLKPLLTAFYFLLFKRLVEFAEKNNNRLPIPVRFILDEFANIGRVPNFDNRISFDRGLGINYTYIVQNRTQLNTLYGSDLAETFLGNTDIRIALRVNDQRTASYFSQQLGDAEVIDVSERKDVTLPWKRLGMTKKTESRKRMSLLEPWQFYEMPFFTAVARIPTCRPFYYNTVAFSDLKEYGELSKEPKTVANFAPPISTEVATPPIPAQSEEEEVLPKQKQARLRKTEKESQDVANVLEGEENKDIMDLFKA